MSKLRTLTWVTRMFGYLTAVFNKDTVLCLSEWAHGWASGHTRVRPSRGWYRRCDEDPARDRLSGDPG